VNKIMRQS